ncbi:MAG: FG-GAP repeat protein, partial [Phycisphaerales bacterium]|nr:FG-GAP repeat protein [Phycisphaerales bacterium]
MFPTTIRSSGVRSTATVLTAALALCSHVSDGHAAPCTDTPCAGDVLTTNGLPSIGAFGRAVDVDAGRSVIGASVPFPGLDPAAALVYTRDAGEWMEQPLVRPDAVPNESFGTDVAIDGSIIIVGAPATTVGVGATGAAYIFTNDGSSDGFMFAQRLVDADPSFGTSVAVDGGRIAIARPDAAPAGAV